MRRRWLIGVVAAAALVIAGVVGGLLSSVVGASSTPTPPTCAVGTVADRVLPSVVTINAGGPAGTGTGSGEVIRPDGYVLTNNHVISGGAGGGRVQVTFADGASVPATIVGRDPLTDLAVLKVQPPHPLQTIAFGKSAAVRVGDPVVAVGAPLGLSGTVTAGIVSALDRTVQVPGGGGRAALLASALQTDAAINPGNSGGALVDCAGQIVGVPTAGATVPSPTESTSGSIGLGFAIPIDFARPIADELIATGRVTHAAFGVQALPIPAVAARQAGVPGGLHVLDVQPGGPSQRAGLRAGDTITEIDGAPATTTDQLAVLTITRKPGDVVGLGFVRAGVGGTANVVLGVAPAPT